MHFYSAMFLVSCLGPGEKYYVEILPSEMFFFFLHRHVACSDDSVTGK